MNRKQLESASYALFEDDFLVRSLGRIAHDPDVALTELVANSWDAGASVVRIEVPSKRGQVLKVEDDGHGMTEEQFKSRWMVLGYDRERHQGTNVEFPPQRSGQRRRAYGRNGVGRHGLLCFADKYIVETARDGLLSRFEVTTESKKNPFVAHSHAPKKSKVTGTRLSVNVERHLPDADRVRTILAARFLQDPQFKVLVNGQSISLPEHTGLIERAELAVADGMPVAAFVVDSTKTAASTLYQGIAFWVNNRLLGTPSWSVGNTTILDGRGRFAKRYSIVVSCGEEWISEVEADWSRFKSSAQVSRLFEAVALYAVETINKLSSEFVRESSEEVLVRHGAQFRSLTARARFEVASFTEEVVRRNPAISQDVLATAVQAVINLERSRSGVSLLEKLTTLAEDDIDGLDRLLRQWTVTDALAVLDEIDARLSVVVAIEKLCSDPATDELHTLHPLVTQARWLFGPEFDSHEYASNQTLKQAAIKVFNVSANDATFRNWRQRPDLLVKGDSTFSIVATEAFDGSSSLSTIQSVLIIELKKGNSTIGREEMNQADGYVQDFMSCELIEGKPAYRAFVVGYQIDARTAPKKEIAIEDGYTRGTVQAATYLQIVRTAQKRLMNLRARIPSRFEEVSGVELANRVLQSPTQQEMS